MKLTPANRKFLAFMSGTWGRVVRGAMGVTLVTIALLGTGWSLLLLPLGILMIGTGVANYCPAVLLYPEWKKEQQLVASMPSYKLK
ncbi:MAG: hypothetical protein RLZZ249_70 [Actinomycetota bacterium]|jgi:hypothetical protein